VILFQQGEYVAMKIR